MKVLRRLKNRNSGKKTKSQGNFKYSTAIYEGRKYKKVSETEKEVYFETGFVKNPFTFQKEKWDLKVILDGNGNPVSATGRVWFPGVKGGTTSMEFRVDVDKIKFKK